MTAPNGDIVFNNSTGSDTAASGLGPATAVSGAGADLDATSTVDLSADSPDLSGVSAGDLLWVDTTSGRQYSIIASVDDGADTVTCDDAFGVTESGRNWGIGGKREGADLSDDAIIDDAKPGWIIDIEETGSNYVLGGALSFTVSGDDVDGAITVKSSSATKPIIQGQAGNSFVLNITPGNAEFFRWEYVVFEGRSTSDTNVVTLSGGSDSVFYRCVFRQNSTGTGGALLRDNQNNAFKPVSLIECEFDGNDKAIYGIERNGGTRRRGHQIIDCRLHNIAGEAIFLGDTESCTISGNIIHKCDQGIELRSDSYGATIIDNLFYDIDGDAISLAVEDNLRGLVVKRNVFSVVTGDAISAASVTVAQAITKIDRNAFHSITGANYNNLNAGPNDIALSASPFVDAAGGDFNINDTAGGGALLRAATITLP